MVIRIICFVLLFGLYIWLPLVIVSSVAKEICWRIEVSRGDAAFKHKEFDISTKNYSESLKIARWITNDEEKINASLGSIILALDILHKHKEADELAKQLNNSDIYRDPLKPISEKLVKAAIGYLKSGNEEEANIFLRRAIYFRVSKNEQLRNKNSLSRLLFNLVALLDRENSFKSLKQQDIITLTQYILKKARDEHREGVALLSMGYLVYEQGAFSPSENYPAAERYYKEAVKSAGVEHDQTTLAGALSALGNLKFKQKNYIEARTYYKKALVILEAIDPINTDIDDIKDSLEESIAAQAEQSDKHESQPVRNHTWMDDLFGKLQLLISLTRGFWPLAAIIIAWSVYQTGHNNGFYFTEHLTRLLNVKQHPFLWILCIVFILQINTEISSVKWLTAITSAYSFESAGDITSAEPFYEKANNIINSLGLDFKPLFVRSTLYGCINNLIAQNKQSAAKIILERAEPSINNTISNLKYEFSPDNGCLAAVYDLYETLLKKVGRTTEAARKHSFTEYYGEVYQDERAADADRPLFGDE